MSEPESFRDQLSRVGQMADDDSEWDLSEHDRAALGAVLIERDTLRCALIALEREMRTLAAYYRADPDDVAQARAEVWSAAAERLAARIPRSPEKPHP
jgi:hypothetical protein